MLVSVLRKGCLQRVCIAAGGAFDAGPARCVKPHIDLMLKLHKMLNNDRLPEPKMNSDKMMK